MEKTEATVLQRKISKSKVKAIIAGLMLVVMAIFAWYYYWGRNPFDFQIASSKQYQFLFSIQDSEHLKRPMGIGISNKGWVFVTDTGRNTVEVFDGNGRYRFSMAGKDNKTGKLNYPIAVAVSPKQEVYVADFYNQRLQIFSTSGKFLRVFPDEEDAGKLGTHIMPTAITFDEAGKAYVVDVNMQRILVLNEAGKLESYFGQPGSSPGKLSYPNGIGYIADKQWLLVANSNNARVDVFSSKGKFVKTVLDSTSLTNPRGVAWDQNNNLVAVVDNLAHTLTVSDLEGKKQEKLGTRGIGSGQFNFPNHAAFDDRGRLFVTDRENGMVQVFARK